MPEEVVAHLREPMARVKDQQRSNPWPEFVDQTVAAEILGFDRTTLMTWRSRGTGPPFYKISRGNKQGSVRYRPAELLDWMQQFRRLHTLE